MVTSEQAQRQTELFPPGLDRFGKAIDHLGEVSDAHDELPAACITLNPVFEHRTVTLVGELAELTGSTKVVIATTVDASSS